ncbi:MAG TPA: inorganic pyrophosphatase [Blastocatellia bacterium]|nr:inorganic pyrophosphatase [Blastocatellia bacterium]
MNKAKADPIWKLMGLLFQSHPWHGVPIGDDWPDIVTAYVEIVPTDTVKYELDKTSGLLKIDRPQRFSNVCPSNYGLVPQTYCGEKVAELFGKRSGRSGIVGDGDPLDICVLSDRTISHSNLLLKAIPIGGLSMLDGEEADDKIIAVMEGDVVYGLWRDVSECPRSVVDRLTHYFLTYKQAPGSETTKCEITGVYGREAAHEVIRAAHDDYLARFADIEEVLAAEL